MSPATLSAAQLVLDWLREPDPLPYMADAAIGFGHFDLRIPLLCGRFARESRVLHVVFTGGIGAGTGSLGRPEADAFLSEFSRNFPDVAAKQIVTENRSTNTGENIRFTAKMLARRGLSRTLGKGICSVVLVAHPSRLRRVRQTWRRMLPAISAGAIAPSTDLPAELALYAANGLSLPAQLAGEVDRLLAYPARGWIAPVAVPSAILAARDELAAAPAARRADAY